MGKNALSERNNWQTQSGSSGLAGEAEKNLFVAFEKAFKDTNYEISNHPSILKHLYEHVTLSDDTLAQIFCPDAATMNAAKKGAGVFHRISQSKTELQGKFC